ncbi:MAG: pyridoxamine 5'-phosphate oxidase [Sphingobacteriales bacterium]|nr:MAG: pyridoxamine 5'-phosphate oxidase [Sphingobacteriales bacterium]
MSVDKITVQNLRLDYKSASLLETDVHQNPIIQFDIWFKQALDAQVLEPNAMTLATATANGLPQARIVLLKEFDAQGFVFYSNYDSQKGLTLLENPYAALVFFWGDLERQIRIEGVVERVSEAESEAYFKLRPRGSQLGALVSPQSTVIANRDFLEDKLQKLEKQFTNKDIPKPQHWGGFRVIPNKIEFWQGRRNRLHDRIVYTHQKDDSWKKVRLAP